MNTPDNTIECDSRTPTIDARLLITGALLFAAWASLFAVTTLGSKIVLAVFALTYLFGCWKTRRGVLYLAPAMMVPYGWLVGYWPGNQLHTSWFATLWQLPGFTLAKSLFATTGTTFEIISGLATLLLFFAFLTPARKSQRAALVTSGLLALASLLNSLLFYYLFCV